MEEVTDLLFVYGSLLDPGNTFADYLHRNSVFYAKGKVKGNLYSIHDYPGAIFTGRKYVYGSVYCLRDLNEALPILDEYEGFGEEEAQPNEFKRVLKEIGSEKGKIQCWAYAYNLSVAGHKRIRSGDYLKWLKSLDNLP